MFVRRDFERIAAPLRHRHRHDLLREPARRRGFGRPLLAAKRKLVLVVPADLEFLGDVLRRLGHRIDTVLCFEFAVNESPAERRVVDFGVAAKSRGRFREHERRTRHRFDATRDHDVCVAAFDRVCRITNGIHPGTAQPVDGRAGHRRRQAGEQQRHPRDIAVVLARLVGAAIDHIVDFFGWQLRIAFCKCRYRYRAEVIGTNR